MTLQQRVGQRRFESPAQEAMVGLLVAAGHLTAALEEACAARGITHDQYNVLRILRGALPGGHPRYAIADRLINRAPDVTRLLDRLARTGCVERARSAEDRRLSVTRITRKGTALLEALDSEILAAHERFAAPLSRAERRTLAGLCGKLLAP